MSIDRLLALGIPKNEKFILRTNHKADGVKLIFQNRKTLSFAKHYLVGFVCF